MVGRRPRVGTGVALRLVLRHRLVAPRAGAGEQGVAARLGRPLRCHPRTRRAAAWRRPLGGHAPRRLLRGSFPHRPVVVRRSPGRRGQAGGRRRGGPARRRRGAACGARGPTRSTHRSPAPGAGGVVEGAPGGGARPRSRGRRRARPRARRPERPAGRAAFVRRPAPAPRAAVVPPGVLARGRPRDQLPALLRHQRPGRSRDGRARAVRGEPRPRRAADRRGRGGRAAARPRGRSARPEALPGPSAAPGRGRRSGRRALLRGGREDPGATRGAPRRLGHGRDDGVRLLGRRQRPAGGRGRRARAHERLHEARRRHAGVRRPRRGGQASDHAGVAGERAERARQPVPPPRPAEPSQPRLPVVGVPRRAHERGRALPRLPHLRHPSFDHPRRPT